MKARRASLSNTRPEDWQRRWFLLKDGCLLYYEGMQGVTQGKPKGALGVGDNQVFAYLCEPNPGQVRFNVESRGRVYHLATEEKADADAWIEALVSHPSSRSSAAVFPLSYEIA